MNSTLSDEAGRALAAWLAPYLAEQLGRVDEHSSAVVLPVGTSAEAFDDAGSREFVRGLGDKVLVNSWPFFSALNERGQIGSLEVARMIGVSSPRNIPAVLTTPLKRRAKALGLPLPWRSGADHEGRTLWFAISDISEKLVKAIDDELKARNSEVGS